MKRKVTAGFLCMMLLCSIFAVPASAYQVQSWGEITCDQFTSDWYGKHPNLYEERGLMALEYASFSDGLLLIWDSNDNYNYVNVNGELVDLNRGRFFFMSTFHEGLASVQTKDYASTGFVDTQGNIVLDTSKYKGSFHYYETMTTRFVDGKTIVHNNGWLDLRAAQERIDIESSATVPTNYYIIDTKGNVLETIPDLKTLMEHPLFKTAICNWQGVPLGVLMNPQEYIETSVPETPYVPEEPVVQEYIRPELPDFPDAETYFQSKGKVTSIVLADMDLCSFMLTVTNDTDYTDSGVIAVVGANSDNTTGTRDTSGVFFVPYYLEAHSSTEIEIPTRNIAHMLMFGENALIAGSRLTAEALTGQVGACVIHFEDEDDLCNFYEMIPYEQSWEPMNFSNEFQPICNGAAGVEFLNMLGISRPVLEEDAKHEFCRR